MISNIHTHTVFCDGRDTPEELAERAAQLGFVSLGFSSHSDTGFDPCGMRTAEEYRRAVYDTRERWRGRLEIYCGVEQDYFSGRAGEDWDFVIGSVHYVLRGGKRLAVDWSVEETARIVREEYGGDRDAFAEDYYALVGKIHSVTGCGIVGHFDLIEKFAERGERFDSPRCRDAAMDALGSICGRGLIFEVNTGAMARGYRSSPYPSPAVLRELYLRGEEITITTDCHDRRFLDFGWDAACRAALKAGYTSALILRGGKFERISL